MHYSPLAANCTLAGSRSNRSIRLELTFTRVDTASLECSTLQPARLTAFASTNSQTATMLLVACANVNCAGSSVRHVYPFAFLHSHSAPSLAFTPMFTLIFIYTYILPLLHDLSAFIHCPLSGPLPLTFPPVLPLLSAAWHLSITFSTHRYSILLLLLYFLLGTALCQFKHN